MIIMLITMGIAALWSSNNYHAMRHEITGQLNKAVVNTVNHNRQLWLSTDTIKAYGHLQTVMGGSVVLSGANSDFLKFIENKKLRTIARLEVNVGNEGETSPHNTTGTVTSDTLIWLTPNGEKAGLTMSFRGVAECSALTIFGMSEQQGPLAMMIAAMLWGCVSIVYIRKHRPACTHIYNNVKTESCNPEQSIEIGNLRFMPVRQRFFNADNEQLRLTPMQDKLMQMFMSAPDHRLSKTDICTTLWNDKYNAEESLYTLVRRLKQTIEKNSNLRIVNDRGTAYSLEVYEI